MICCICKRDVEDFYIEKHHLIPKCKKGKETIDVCSDCGKYLHKVFSIKDMVRKYHTLECILSHEKIQNWIQWVSKRPNMRNICMKHLK